MELLAATPGGFAIRGQAAAVDVARSLLAGSVPHAILVVGPPSVGKATLALDIAAALLCGAADPAARPCRDCRACRLVAGGGHADVHRLGDPAGGETRIGSANDPEPGTVRRVIHDLTLTSNEGGYRVVIADAADRMNEDAQNALLKVLEEPPPGVVLLLCASAEERLLPTVRSRCARIRLGTVGVREIEALLADRGLADAPTAARLARIAGGRPGLAISLAAAPDVIARRGEVARTLLDALDAPTAVRLALVRELTGTVGEIAAALGGAGTDPSQGGPPARPEPSADDPEAADPGADGTDADAETAAAPARGGKGSATGARKGGATGSATGRPTPADRRRAALALVGIWRDLARDLLLVARGGRALVGDPALLEELERVAPALDEDRIAGFLARAERTGRLIERNANPELALDTLVLAWPQAPTGPAR